MENVFVWEHLQTAEAQSRGAWLGMNFNPKGGCSVYGKGRAQAARGMLTTVSRLVKVQQWIVVIASHLETPLPPIPIPTPSQWVPSTGGTLVWQDNTAVNYSNWGPPGLGPSMLSHNSCYWIQSSSGLWRPGACTNITMGVVCKLPRGKPGSRSTAGPIAGLTAGCPAGSRVT
jgi:hypothetical protein